MVPGESVSRQAMTGMPVDHGRPQPEAARPPEARRLGRVYEMVVGVWGVGALALLGWLFFCQLHLVRLRRRSQRVDEGAAAVLLQHLCEVFQVNAPLLRVSAQVRTPFLAGLWRPAIFLPADYERQFDGPALRAILAHELVHAARRDCAWNLLARLAGVVGWVQPLVWILGRRLEQASEEMCDEEVVRREGDPRAYADCLLRLSERLLPSAPERAPQGTS